MRTSRPLFLPLRSLSMTVKAHALARLSNPPTFQRKRLTPLYPMNRLISRSTATRLQAKSAPFSPLEEGQQKGVEDALTELTAGCAAFKECGKVRSRTPLRRLLKGFCTAKKAGATAPAFSHSCQVLNFAAAAFSSCAMSESPRLLAAISSMPAACCSVAADTVCDSEATLDAAS